MGKRRERLRQLAIEAMVALAENRFEDADRYFHPDAVWWIIGQGEVPHARIREIAQKTEGPMTKRGLIIRGTVAEGDKVAVEATGDMAYPDGRRYANSYHHVIEFRDELIVRWHEYFDTLYVRQVFGDDVYDEAQASQTDQISKTEAGAA